MPKTRKHKSIHSSSISNSKKSVNKAIGSFFDNVLPEIKEICRSLLVTKSQCVDLMRIINSEIDKGISEQSRPGFGLKMFNTFITEISSQKESASYLALDFKGQYYRVLLYNFSAEFRNIDADETLYIVPKYLRSKSAEQIFDYIAETLKDFLQIRGLEQNSYKMAITFQFPVEMKSLKEAIVTSFNKEFACPSVVGQEVVGLLQRAIDRLGLDIHICALINDTVGALAAGAARDSECRIGLIVSAGTNCSYFEKTALIKKPLNLGKQADEVVLNTEWGALGDNGSLESYRTEFDKQVDLNSSYPGSQLFEKMISTLYVGEICRLIILKAIEEHHLFGGVVPDKMNITNSFTAQYLFEIDREPPTSYYAVEVILRERFRMTTLRRMDLVTVRYICRTVITRCATLLGAACAAIINRIGRKRITLAVDGAFFRFSETFPDVLVDVIAQLIPYTYTFKLKLIDDASGKGAAAIVATEVALSKQQREPVFQYRLKL